MRSIESDCDARRVSSSRPPHREPIRPKRSPDVASACCFLQNGKKSVRIQVEGGRAGIRKGRIFVAAGHAYDGSLWVKREQGSLQLTLRVVSSKGGPIATAPIAVTGSGWQDAHYSFFSSVRDTEASVEIAAEGSGTLLLDFVSMMRADVRRNGLLRPDLLQALRDLAPPFIRWPGGLA